MSNTRLSLQQAVAALSVVLSLVFVGYEIRQNTQVARGAAVEASIDQTRYTWVVVSTVRITENRFRQMQMGVIDDGDLGIGGGTSKKVGFEAPTFSNGVPVLIGPNPGRPTSSSSSRPKSSDSANRRIVAR